jgi:ABC-type amino acid transport substrate-binding protein
MSILVTRRLMLGTMLAAGAVPAIALPLDKVIAKRTLRIAVYRDFAPWSWSKNGVLTGIDVDLGKMLADRLGLQVDYFDLLAGEDVDDDLRIAVWKGPILGAPAADIMMHIPYDRAFALRNDRVFIVAPYYRESFAMACDRNAIDCDVPPPEMKGHKLAAEIDSIPDFYLSGAFGGVLRGDVVHARSGAAAVGTVGSGGADVVMATRAQIENAVHDGATTLAVRKAAIPALSSPGWDIGLAIKDDGRDLADRIESEMASLTADGTLAALFARYGVTRTPPRAG